MGLSGLFTKSKKYGLLKAYIVAILARGAFHVLGGYLYWMDFSEVSDSIISDHLQLQLYSSGRSTHNCSDFHTSSIQCTWKNEGNGYRG